MSINRKINVAIIGMGKIGIDLLFKIRRSNILSCVLVVSRSRNSNGLEIARQLGINVSDQGIEEILSNQNNIDIIFDATSAVAHMRHWEILKNTKIKVIDMTPSKIGKSIVPAVNLSEIGNSRNINMISCGGQSSIPIINAISSLFENLKYIEVVSSIASKSAGAATRINLDEYIHTTEHGILEFSCAKRSKVILILNPAEPPVNMQTTISLQLKNPPMQEILNAVRIKVEEVKKYVPGYELIVEPKQIDSNRVVVMLKIEGMGDYLPKYAGNLDIINCAAVAVATKMATDMLETCSN